MAAIDEQRESDRLMEVRKQIESLVQIYDVCIVGVLAGRAGRAESFIKVDATWSRLTYTQTKGSVSLQLRSHADDYEGDFDRRKRELEWTIGMTDSFAHLIGSSAFMWLECARAFNEATGAQHTPLERVDRHETE